MILADPPWRFAAGYSARAAEAHYPTMTTPDITALPVGGIAEAAAAHAVAVVTPHPGARQ